MSQDPVVITFVGRKVTPSTVTVKAGPRPADRVTLRELRELVQGTEDWSDESVVEAMIEHGNNRFAGLRVRDVDDGDRRRTVRTLEELGSAIGTNHAILRSRKTGNLFSVHARLNLSTPFLMRLVSPSQPAQADLVFEAAAEQGLEIIWEEKG